MWGVLRFLGSRHKLVIVILILVINQINAQIIVL